jgi:hypothetical protein
MSLGLGRTLRINDLSDGIWIRDLDLEYLEKIGWGGVDWIGLAQDRDKWRILVNEVKKLRVS